MPDYGNSQAQGQVRARARKLPVARRRAFGQSSFRNRSNANFSDSLRNAALSFNVRARAAKLAFARQRRRYTPLHVLVCVWKSIAADNVSLLAAGVAFYALLAIFPGLVFFVAVFGLLAETGQVQNFLLTLKDVLPTEAWEAINAQVEVLVRQNTTSLSLATMISLGLAFINARLGVYALMSALNGVYRRTETRSFAHTNSLAILFTLGALAVLAFNILVVAAVPGIFRLVGISEFTNAVLHYARWPALAIIVALSLAVVYRYGPDRKDAHWRWVSLGSLAATALWLAASTGFSWYVSAFNSYDRIYGSFGAVVILLYWLWLTAFAALMGAELDMQIQTALEERQ
jgi:membrane protein